MQAILGHRYFCTTKRRSGECIRSNTVSVRLLDRDTQEKWWTKVDHLKHHKPPGPEWLDEDVLCCNCAMCDRVIVAQQDAHRANRTPIVAGRHNDRPYCAKCFPRLKT